jgi:deoxyadenosine/deoxycytidine kinase
MNIIISCEGNIGSGKSTLLSILQSSIKFKDIVFVKEPVEEWYKINDSDGKNIFEKFYESPEKYAYPFQELTLMSRYTKIKDAVNLNPNKIIISERSVFSDHYIFAKMMYDKGYISDMEYQIYKHNANIIKKELCFSKYIYIRSSSDKCIERINKRNRSGENITDDYIKLCEKYHDVWLFNIDNILIINGNDDFENNIENQNNILNQIYDFILT